MDDKLNMLDKKDKTINLEVSINDMNTIMAALQELPHRIADPVLKKVFAQAQSQLGVQS